MNREAIRNIGNKEIAVKKTELQFSDENDTGYMLNRVQEALDYLESVSCNFNTILTLKELVVLHSKILSIRSRYTHSGSNLPPLNKHNEPVETKKDKYDGN